MLITKSYLKLAKVCFGNSRPLLDQWVYVVLSSITSLHFQWQVDFWAVWNISKGLEKERTVSSAVKVIMPLGSIMTFDWKHPSFCEPRLKIPFCSHFYLRKRVALACDDLEKVFKSWGEVSWIPAAVQSTSTQQNRILSAGIFTNS